MNPLDNAPNPELTAADQSSMEDHEPRNESGNRLADLRLRRIEDLQCEALAKPDSLEANLGAANGALLRIGYRLEQVLEGALGESSNPLERFEQLRPAIETQLKIMRQVDRLAQLDQRLVAARHTGHPSKPR